MPKTVGTQFSRKKAAQRSAKNAARILGPLVMCGAKRAARTRCAEPVGGETVIFWKVPDNIGRRTEKWPLHAMRAMHAVAWQAETTIRHDT